MKYGLVLAGGGGKGSYQIGALKALYEHGYKFDVVSGTSIGALNAAMITFGTLDDATNLWYSIESTLGNELNAQFDRLNDEAVMNMNYLFANPDKLFKFKDVEGVLDNSSFVKVLSNYVTYDSLNQLSEELYACSVPAIEDPSPTYFKINDYDARTAIDAIISSTALPCLFDGIQINKEVYFDGGLLDVRPIKPVYDSNCDVIVVICLHQDVLIDTDMYPNTTIIPIIPSQSLGGFKDGTMDFTQSGAKWRMELGYKDAIAVLNHNE